MPHPTHAVRCSTKFQYPIALIPSQLIKMSETTEAREARHQQPSMINQGNQRHTQSLCIRTVDYPGHKGAFVLEQVRTGNMFNNTGALM